MRIIYTKEIVSSGGLAVEHLALGAKGHRFDPNMRSKLFQRIISQLTTSWVVVIFFSKFYRE